MLNRIRNYEFRIDLPNFDFMEKKRKILLVAKKYSFKEAEEADDKFW